MVRVAAEAVPGVRAVTDNLIVKPIKYGYQWVRLMAQTPS